MNTLATESCISECPRHNQSANDHTQTRQAWNRTIAIAMLTLLFTTIGAVAQVNGIGAKPYLGWSTFSEQTIVPSSSGMS